MVCRHLAINLRRNNAAAATITLLFCASSEADSNSSFFEGTPVDCYFMVFPACSSAVFCPDSPSISSSRRVHHLPAIYSCHKLCTPGIQTPGRRLKGLQSFKSEFGWQEERRCNIFSNGKLLHSRPPGFIQCTASQLSYPINATDFSEENVDCEKVGVLLLNLGGPETLHDVQPFLYNLFADPDIIRLPRLFRFLQQPLAKLISVTRAPKSKEGYRAIGGGSPLRKITNEQADALKEALKSKKLAVNVYVGMRYWHPFTEEAIEQIKREKVTKLVVLPLYPHFSISTTGSSISVLQSIFLKDEYFLKLPYSIIESWYQREGYIKTMADLTEKELSKFANSKEVVIFFSAHGVPCAYVEKYSDPYKSQMEQSVDLIIKELKARGVDNEHILAYQSRVGPVEWLKPYTDETITQLGQKGVKNLLVVPISFVSEHIETLEEIDQEYRHLALSSGIENWGRVPTLGCQPAFIRDLADAVLEALPSVKSMLSSEHSPQQADTDKRSLITEIIE